MSKIIILILGIGLVLQLKAQDLSLKVGTEFPLQHFIGLNYLLNEKYSVDLSYGRIDEPYDNELYNWIKVPDDKKAEVEFLQFTSEGGSVLEVGGNYHHKNWNFGFYVQKLRLNSSGTYRKIIDSDLFREDLTSQELSTVDQFFNSPFALFVNTEDRVSLQTDAIQLGLKVGRSFSFKNPKLTMFAEFGWSKNLTANSEPTYDRSLIENIIRFEEQRTGTTSQLSKSLDVDEKAQEIEDLIIQYGYIPNLTIGVAYKIYKLKRN